MYDELVKQLRDAAISADSGYEISESLYRDILQAADAIEELQAVVDGLNAQTSMVFEETEGRTVIKFEPKWIPVTERLPEAEDMVLVATVHGGVYYGFLHHAGKFYTANNTRYDSWCWEPDVTHWMRLPEPPKEGEWNEYHSGVRSVRTPAAIR